MRIDNREVPLSDGRTRHQATIMDDDDPDGKEVRRMWFLQTLVNNPAILVCGGKRFDSVVIRHDGMRWVAEMEAVTERVKA